MQASDGLGWAASSSDNDEEGTSDADEWDCGEEDGERGVAVLRRLPSRSSPSPVGSTHGRAADSSTEDEPLDDTGSDSEEDMEESRRLKWKRCRRQRPPMMEMWAAVREIALPTPRLHLQPQPL